MAKLARAGGGFRAESNAPEMIGQMQLLDIDDLQTAKKAVLSEKERLLAEAAEIIENWNHRADIDSIGMTLFMAWWHFAREMGDNFPARLIRENKPLPVEAQKTLLMALKQAISYMENTYKSIRVPWGDVHRIKRGDKDWPLEGVGRQGWVTLRAVSGGDPDENGMMYSGH